MCPGRACPSGVRDDVKLGGPGHAVRGRRNRAASDSPGPPLLHEVKLPGPEAGGCVCRLRQEGKLALLHEVKLLALDPGGGVFGRLRQEGKLALQHEVKLWKSQAGRFKSRTQKISTRSLKRCEESLDKRRNI